MQQGLRYLDFYASFQKTRTLNFTDLLLRKVQLNATQSRNSYLQTWNPSTPASLYKYSICVRVVNGIFKYDSKFNSAA